MRIVIVGGSFGGLSVAYELRKHFTRADCEITLASRDQRFTFIPSLPWVALGTRTLQRISFELEPSLAAKGVEFLDATVQRIEPEEKRVMAANREYAYDYLVIATGHRSANEAVPGLGPFDGPGHSLMSPPEAEEARTALQVFLENPGPMVIGCAQGASCIGPAYEFAFEIDHLLRKRRRRHQVPIHFVTPEPFLGHRGIGGVGRARQFLEGAFEEPDIQFHTSVEMDRITDEVVELADGSTFASQFSKILPSLAGVDAITHSPGLGNPKGFIPVDAYYRHQQFPQIYAVGVAVAMPPADDTPVPVNFPKTGHMTEQMAVIASGDIAIAVRGGERRSRPLTAECILDMGDRAARIKADPVRPPRNTLVLSEGKRWLWAKRIFERYYLWRLRRGAIASSGWGW